MITIKNITKNIEHVVKPTVFPDGTQQVWNLPQDLMDNGKVQIIWHYESDNELMVLIQASVLMTHSRRHDGIELIVPFLPYGRQDKDIGNETTFGFHVFRRMLNSVFPFKYITTFDAHNLKILKNTDLYSKNVQNEVIKACDMSEADLVCFPDKGASERGYVVGKPSFHLSKTRDQSTGKITGMKCDLPLDLKGKKILIVDDICDGGKTFKEAAKILKDMGAETVSLYVTHGIFSAGIYSILAGGIDHIYTTDSFKTKATLTDKVTVFKLEL